MTGRNRWLRTNQLDKKKERIERDPKQMYLYQKKKKVI